jgi:hypothetical protein
VLGEWLMMQGGEWWFHIVRVRLKTRSSLISSLAFALDKSKYLSFPTHTHTITYTFLIPCNFSVDGCTLSFWTAC